MKCEKCGTEVPADAKFCVSCGAEVKAKKEETASPAAPTPPPPAPAPAAQTAGPVSAQIEDPFLKKWNWGAFLLHWIWAFGHGLPVWGIIGLVAMFVPFLGSLALLGIAIYLGIKGNELAWQTGRYLSFEVLKETEKKWTKWAVIIFIIGIVLGVLLAVGGVILAVMLSSESYVEYIIFL